MNFLERLERDAPFGIEVMQAAGIRTIGPLTHDGLHIHVLQWYSLGRPIWPVFAYFQECDGIITLMWPYNAKEPRIYQATLRKVIPIMAKTKHGGIVAMHVLIRSADNKAYGLRWKTGLNNDILRATEPIIDVTITEWLEAIEAGCDIDWFNNKIHYMYSGTAVEELIRQNGRLLALKGMGYELPVNSANPLNQASEALAAPACGCVHSRPPKSPKTSQADAPRT